ncbi:MAG: S46 family peptidase, partial [Bacteroidales bacterium]
NDPVFQLQNAFRQLQQTDVEPMYLSLNDELDKLYRKYVRGLRQMKSDEVFYPDANFTMRIAYGQVNGYRPKDAVKYNYYTTLSGVIDKDDPDVYDYDVPEKLKELYAQKDYGKYGEDGEMHVAFIATNHTSGGNSGSPVINDEGHLIGVNFDRNWEGTMSDIMYDPSQCRNITLDIRYALFIIDKFAGAGHLVDEMTLIE